MPVWLKIRYLSYSQIKIDQIADFLLNLDIKIGVHLISVELSQLLTLVISCEKKNWMKIGMLLHEDLQLNIPMICAS